MRTQKRKDEAYWQKVLLDYCLQGLRKHNTASRIWTSCTCSYLQMFANDGRQDRSTLSSNQFWQRLKGVCNLQWFIALKVESTSVNLGQRLVHLHSVDDGAWGVRRFNLRSHIHKDFR